MDTLFSTKTTADIIQRIHQLERTSLPKWGEMSVTQMLAHCQVGFKVATGELQLKRSFTARIIGPFAKMVVLNNKPFKQNLPTAKEFMVDDYRDFEYEKQALIQMIEHFCLKGEKGVTTLPHPLFGKMKPEEWSKSLWKHLDHHLRQFGV